MPSALLEGQLLVRQGCFVIARPEETWVLLWPQTFAPVELGGLLGVTNGRVEAVMAGSFVAIGGGELTEGERGTQLAVELTEGALPLMCRTPKYWLATSIDEIEEPGP